VRVDKPNMASNGIFAAKKVANTKHAN
jgi:hypothetical protein